MPDPIVQQIINKLYGDDKEDYDIYEAFIEITNLVAQYNQHGANADETLTRISEAIDRAIPE